MSVYTVFQKFILVFSYIQYHRLFSCVFLCLHYLIQQYICDVITKWQQINLNLKSLCIPIHQISKYCAFIWCTWWFIIFEVLMYYQRCYQNVNYKQLGKLDVSHCLFRTLFITAKCQLDITMTISIKMHFLENKYICFKIVFIHCIYAVT